MPKSIAKHVTAGDVRYPVLAFVCPGCASDGSSGLHMLAVNTDLHSPAWTWEGVFEFLPDSTHRFAGTSVPMPDLEDWML